MRSKPKLNISKLAVIGFYNWIFLPIGMRWIEKTKYNFSLKKKKKLMKRRLWLKKEDIFLKSKDLPLGWTMGGGETLST